MNLCRPSPPLPVIIICEWAPGASDKFRLIRAPVRILMGASQTFYSSLSKAISFSQSLFSSRLNKDMSEIRNFGVYKSGWVYQKVSVDL